MIRVDGLKKVYGDVEALKGVSFEAQHGEVIGVLGLNGAGKSTLLRVLAGDLTPSEGRVTVDDVNLDSDPRTLRSRIGFLPETAPVYGDMTVRDFLRFIGRLNGVEPGALDARIHEVATTTNVAHQLDRIIGELSMGYRKRVGIAQAILHDPKVVILDEPVSSLDPAEIVGMRKLVRSLGGKHTVLVSSHILHEVEETCDRILVLHDGELVAEGTEEELGLKGGADTVSLELELRGAADVVTDALAELGEVDGLEQDGDLVRLRLAVDEQRREDVVPALVAAGLKVRSMAEAESGLEAVFLGLVQEAKA